MITKNRSPPPALGLGGREEGQARACDSERTGSPRVENRCRAAGGNHVSDGQGRGGRGRSWIILG